MLIGAPIEIAIGLLRPDTPQHHYKLHNRVNAVDFTDLVQISTA